MIEIIEDLPINSLNWWENYFDNYWEKNNGRAQTQAFMAALLKAIPLATKNWITENTSKIVDWGCALGDGLEIIHQYFKKQIIAGVDFSNIARKKAKNLHPNYFFYDSLHSFTIKQGLADVVFNSNCLEHFANPFDQLAQGLKFTRFLHLILVPYKEQPPLCSSHLWSFDEQSFPQEIADFKLIFKRVINVDQRYWHGQQLLMIYASAAFMKSAYLSNK